MKLTLPVATVLLILSASIGAYAHDQTPPMYKWENGFMLAFSGISSDATGNQISISDEHGQRIAQFNVLRMIPEARRVSIYDVTTNGELVAVAAVYESKEGNKKVRPTATLLVLNTVGELRFALALSPSHAIARLVMDAESHIWTLTDGADTEVSPSKVPMIVEYTAEGRVMREVLTRDMFPFHAVDTKADVIMGRAVMGCDSGVVWFWLPGSTEFVTISTNDGKAAIRKTELPKRPGRREVVLAIARESSGNVVGQFREDDDQFRAAVPADIAHYVWVPSTGSWSQFTPARCEAGRLIGSSEKGPVYMQKESSGSQTPSMCIADAQ